MAVTQSLSVTEVSGSVNIDANTSQVRILWTSTQSGDSWNSSTRTAKYYVSINGGEYTEYSVSYTLPQNATVTIVDTTITVTHKNNGSGSVHVKTWMDTGTSAGVVEKAYYCSLTDIPKAVRILVAPAATLGLACSIRCVSNTSTRDNWIRFKFSLGNWSHTTPIFKKTSAGGFTYTDYTFPYEVAKQFPNAASGKMTVDLYTYTNEYGYKQIGDASSDTFTVTLPENDDTKPYATEMSASPVSSLTNAFASLYLQGYSKVKVTSTDKGRYGATIVSKSVTVDGKTYGSESNYTSEWLSGYGSVTVTLNLEDSRGFTNSLPLSITVIPYGKPRVAPASDETSVICARCDANGNLNDSGTSLRIKARRSFSQCIVDGVQKNFCELRYRYRNTGDSNFSEWMSLLLGANTSTEEIDAVVLRGSLLVTESYVVQVDAIDSVPNNNFLPFNIPTEEIYMHKAGSIGSLGFGEYVEAPNTISIAKSKKVRLKSDINGVRMYSKAVSGTADLDINTKYADFSGTGNERQTFFVFGEANGTMVYGVARVANNGTTLWAGTDGVTLTTKTGGVLTVVLPKVAYDIFTIISGRDFTV